MSYYAANHMTAFDWFRFFDPNHKLTKDQMHYILYDMTGYPMRGMKIVIPQLRRAIRCYEKGIELCPCCGQNVKWHEKDCSLNNNNK